MLFDDAGLVRCIREAVQTLYRNQVFMARLGMRAGSAAEPDLLVDSSFMKEVFDLPWRLEKSDAMPDALLMDPDEQPSLMTLRAGMLEGDSLFACCRGALPDFLAPRTGRAPLPRARWKQLWAAAPSSVAALERRLAELAEQALWGVAADPALEARAPTDAGSGDAGAAALELELGLALEEAGPEKAASKAKRKKRRQAAAPRRDAEGPVPVADVVEAEQAVPGEAEPELACADHDEAVAPPAQGAEDAAAGPAAAGEAREPEPSAHGREEPHARGAAPAPMLPCAWAAQPYAWAAQPPEDDGEGLGCPGAAAGPDREQPLARGACPGSATTVLRHHYWGGRADRSTLRWCLPSARWPRGRWARPDESPARATAAAAVVRNTFIEIKEGDSEPQLAARLSRSVSP